MSWPIRRMQWASARAGRVSVYRDGRLPLRELVVAPLQLKIGDEILLDDARGSAEIIDKKRRGNTVYLRIEAVVCLGIKKRLQTV